MRMMLMLHITAGGLGLVSGFVALFAGKGAGLHHRSGLVFVYAMATMGISGAVMAALTGVETSVIAGSLTAYLVVTALTAVRPPTAGTRRLDLAATLVGVSTGLASIAFGLQSLSRGEAVRDEMPVPMLFVIGAIALLGSATDVRVMRAGGLRGGARLARHLWRMCLALFIAAGSFFGGQADRVPEALRTPLLLTLPVLAPLAVMVYWLWRVRIRPKLRGRVGAREPARSRAGVPLRAG